MRKEIIIKKSSWYGNSYKIVYENKNIISIFRLTYELRIWYEVKQPKLRIDFRDAITQDFLKEINKSKKKILEIY